MKKIDTVEMRAIDAGVVFSFKPDSDGSPLIFLVEAKGLLGGLAAKVFMLPASVLVIPFGSTPTDELVNKAAKILLPIVYGLKFTFFGQSVDLDFFKD